MTRETVMNEYDENKGCDDGDNDDASGSGVRLFSGHMCYYFNESKEIACVKMPGDHQFFSE